MGDSPSECECGRGLQVRGKGSGATPGFWWEQLWDPEWLTQGHQGKDSLKTRAFQKWDSDNKDTNNPVTGKTETLCKPTGLHKEAFDDLRCQSLKKLKIDYLTH